MYWELAIKLGFGIKYDNILCISEVKFQSMNSKQSFEITQIFPTLHTVRCSKETQVSERKGKPMCYSEDSVNPPINSLSSLSLIRLGSVKTFSDFFSLVFS